MLLRSSLAAGLRRQGLCLLAVAALITLAVQPLSATPSARQRAQTLVREALNHRAYGEDETCKRLLQQAAQIDPAYAPAYWHQGLVESRGTWHPAEKAPVSASATSLNNYRRIRDDYRETVADQMELANRCRDMNLPDHEQAHLLHVLRLSPEHVPALQRLGYQLTPGGWVSGEAISRQQEEAEAARRAFEQWSPRITRLRKEMALPRQQRRERAQQDLLAIRDADAIGSLEAIVSTHSRWHSLMVLKTLQNMTAPAATISIARHAVYSPHSEVRQTAAQYLRERPRESYVPAMLAEMSQPIDARLAMVRHRNGRLRQNVIFTQEKQSVVESNRLRAPADSSALAVQLHRDNARTQRLNATVADALNIATQQDLPADPQVWWSWWDEENEIFVQGEKPVRDFSEDAQLARIDRLQEEELRERQREMQQRIEQQQQALRQVGGFNNIPFPGGQLRRDCLVAGTSIWTSLGTVAVEQIQIGDMVLSQDVNTGEVAYRIVLQTTVRPKGPLVKVKTATETFEVSGGHPFWIAGEGWVKARDVKSGMQLHTLRGSLAVSEVALGGEQETYNLIVDDFSTYFIGESKTLTHDNTPRQPTACIVPGLVAE